MFEGMSGKKLRKRPDFCTCGHPHEFHDIAGCRAIGCSCPEFRLNKAGPKKNQYSRHNLMAQDGPKKCPVCSLAVPIQKIPEGQRCPRCNTLLRV